MANPVILVVDDEPAVLRAVERELRGHYGAEYTVLAADSGTAALNVMRRLALRETPLALIVSDQRMPTMTGIELLAASLELAPDARRVLLTAYADTDVAIRAINEIRLDQYLQKPWDPPEERLFPVLDDLLSDWRATFRPVFEGIRLVGHRWSARAHEIKDYLARNLVPYRWVDVESDPEALRLATAAGIELGRDPLLIFPDGSHLLAPANAAIAEKVGLRTRADLRTYDLVIVGGGPAGLAAAVYGASEGLRTLLVEREAPGGQAGTTSRIENYLGFPAGLSGADLARRAVAQATRLGAELLTSREATALRLEDRYRLVTLDDGSEIACGAVLVAAGVQYRRLEVDGDRPARRRRRVLRRGHHRGARHARPAGGRRRRRQLRRAGRGPPCPICDQRPAPRARGKHRGRDVRLPRGPAAGAPECHDPPECQCCRGARRRGPRGDHGRGCCRGDAHARADGRALPLHRRAPRTEWLAGIVERDGAGFIVTGPALARAADGRVAGWPLAREPFLLETNVPGIFAAGDVRSRSVKRIASGVGEGSMAVQFVHQHLAGL